LAFLVAVNPAGADAFRMVAVQDFDGIAVEDRDDRAGETLRRQRPSLQKITGGKQATTELFCEPSSAYGVFFCVCCSPEGQTVP
jgi:hypothetical protein